MTDTNRLLDNEYWVAHDFIVQAGGKATIHTGDCSWCNHGTGLSRSTTHKDGVWLGPFDAYEEAHAAATATGSEVHLCGHCQPEKEPR